MSEIRLHHVQTNGIRMRVAEAGSGPLVLLCHGFPGAGHWNQQEAPEATTKGLLEFLATL